MRKLFGVLLGVAAMSGAYAINFSQGTAASNVRAQVAQAVAQNESLPSIISTALSAKVTVNALVAALVSAGVGPKEIVAELIKNGVSQEQAIQAALAAGADPADVAAPAAAGPLSTGTVRSPSLNFSAPSTFGGGGGNSVSRN